MTTDTINRRGRSALLPAIILLAAFAWIWFLTQGLPFSTMDDPTQLYIAQKTSFAKIFSRLLNPLTPAWSFQFQMLGGCEANSLSLRITELLIFKTLTFFFGYSPAAFFAVKSLFLALTSLMIYYLINAVARNRLIASLGALFYLSTLPAFMSAFYIPDFGLLAQLLQCAATLVFLAAVAGLAQGTASPRRLAVKLLCLFALVWLAIKSYETAKIFPAICIAFLFFHHWGKWFEKLKKRENCWLLLTLALMFFMVVPIPSSFQVVNRQGQQIKEAASLHYYWDSLGRSLLQNTRNAWENEPSSAFFSFNSCLPFSIARTGGIFLCWIFVFATIYCMSRPRSVLTGLDARQKQDVLFITIWLIFDLFAMGLARESDPRHLMAPLIPFTVFLAVVVYMVLRVLKGRLRPAIVCLCLFGWAYAFVSNLDHQIYFRKFMGGPQIAQDRYFKYIYEDYTKKKLTSYSQLIDFMMVPQQLCAWYIPFILDDQHGTFLERIQPDYLEQLYPKHGAAYIITIEPNVIPKDPRYFKIAVFDELNDSLFTRWILPFKKKRGNLHTLYKFTPSSASRV